MAYNETSKFADPEEMNIKSISGIIHFTKSLYENGNLWNISRETPVESWEEDGILP